MHDILELAPLFGLLAALAPAPAGAAERTVSDTLGVTSGQALPSQPRTRQTSDTLAFTYELGDGWLLDGSFGVAVLTPVPGTRGVAFGTTGTDVWNLSGGVSWEASEHLVAGLSLFGSPSSRLRTDTTVAYQVATSSGTGDALLSSKTSVAGASLQATWDSAGDSDLEWVLEAAATATRFDTDQRIAAFRAADGSVITAAELRTWCATHVCSPELRSLTREHPAALAQLEPSVGITATLWRDTDLTLGAAGDLYDRDPTTVGYFSLLSAGRTASMGGGIPVAPLLWRITPEAKRRFGRVGVGGWYTYGRYVDGLGHMQLVGARVDCRFTEGFRGWFTGAVQRDRDATGNTASYGQGAIGLLWAFE